MRAIITKRTSLPMNVDETMLPSEAPLPHLTGKNAATGAHKRRDSAQLLLNTIGLLLGSILLSWGMLISSVFVANPRFVWSANTINLVIIAIVLLSGIYLVVRSVQGFAIWFRQRRADAT